MSSSAPSRVRFLIEMGALLGGRNGADSLIIGGVLRGHESTTTGTFSFLKECIVMHKVLPVGFEGVLSQPFFRREVVEELFGKKLVLVLAAIFF